MKSMYVRKISKKDSAVAVITLELFRKTSKGLSYTISNVNVPTKYRGQGWGTFVLDDVIDDADSEEVVLVLEIRATGSEMDYDRLERWYRSRGFKPSKKIEGLFIRKPQ